MINALHKLPIVIPGKTLKPLSVFEFRHRNWSGNGPQNKKNLLDIFGNLKKKW